MSGSEDVAGEAPPEGEAQGNGEVTKGDDNRIPLVRVKEMLAAAVLKAKDEFKAEVEARTKAQNEAKPPERQYTKAQLDTLVEDGKITQEVADSVFKNQIVEEATRKAVEGATRAVANRDQQHSVSQQMAAFQKLVPDAWEEGTPEREQVAGAYRALKAAGITGGKDELELAALIAAFGEPENIRKARGFGRSGPSESFQDSGSFDGGRRGNGSDTNDPNAPPKGLTAREFAHYSKRIGGSYADWNAVREERKFAKARQA